MENDKIIFWRNLLLRTFIIGVLFAILVFVLLTVFRPRLEVLATFIFGTDEKEIREVLLTFFMNMRLILIFLILSPTLALHTMIKKK